MAFKTMKTAGFYGPKEPSDAETELLNTMGRLIAYGEYEMIAPKKANRSARAVIEGYAEGGGTKLTRTDAKLIEQVEKLIIYCTDPEAYATLVERIPEDAPNIIYLTSEERLRLFCELAMVFLADDGKLPDAP